MRWGASLLVSTVQEQLSPDRSGRISSIYKQLYLHQERGNSCIWRALHFVLSAHFALLEIYRSCYCLVDAARPLLAMRRTGRAKHLSCFYCGKQTGLKYDGTITNFLCLSCDATNYLDEVRPRPLGLFLLGHVADPALRMVTLQTLPSQRSEKPHPRNMPNPSPPPLSSQTLSFAKRASRTSASSRPVWRNICPTTRPTPTTRTSIEITTAIAGISRSATHRSATSAPTRCRSAYARPATRPRRTTCAA